MIRILKKANRKLARLRAELGRADLDRTGRALHLLELALKATRLSGIMTVRDERIYELTTAPKTLRGLRDLTVRVAGTGDLEQLSELTETPKALILERLTRGDLAYVGILDDRMLAHAWFHRGPEPFLEDQPIFPRWELAVDTAWSYHAFTRLDARGSGVFYRVFQTALTELLNEHGAGRIRCMINAANAPSIALHERIGFRQLGRLVAVSVPGARLVTWHGGGPKRRWLQKHSNHLTFHLPPE